MASLPVCQVVHLGLVEYRRAWDEQVFLAQAVRDGSQPNTLLLLEHPHVFTRGRLSKPEHLFLTEVELAEQGVAVVDTDRGGQVTYHGPGQLVGYPIVNLRNWGGPLKYLRTLEQVIIQTLADLGVAAGLVPGLTGVWIGGAKVAAIGVKISQGVAYHGFSLNVNPDLSYYDHIVPCGITDRDVTSLKELLARPVEMELVRNGLAHRFGQAMGFRMKEVAIKEVALKHLSLHAGGKSLVMIATGSKDDKLDGEAAKDGLR